MDYFAQRLGVAVEELWSEQGATWALQMAEDLRAEGDHVEGRKLLEKTLANLERERELHPRVLVRLHRELGRIDVARGNRASGRAHFEKCLELAGEDESMLAERAEMNAELGELLLQTGNRDQAIQHFQTSAAMFLDLLGRSPALLSGSRGRR